MRRTIFVFAAVASLLMLTCVAAQDTKKEKDSVEVLFDGVTGTVKEITSLFVQVGSLPNFKLSSLLGLFDYQVEEMNIYEKNIEFFYEQCSQEYEEIESIRAWAQAAAENATNSVALTQKINFILERAKTGQTQISEIEKHKTFAKTTKKEADAAKKDFETKEAELMAMVVKALSHLYASDTTKTADDSSANTKTAFDVAAIMNKLVKKGAPIAAEMYLLYKAFDSAAAQTEEAYQSAKLFSKNIKKYFRESEEIEKALRLNELKHAAWRTIAGQNETIISDGSLGFSLSQNTVFLTFAVAFLIANKPSC